MNVSFVTLPKRISANYEVLIKHVLCFARIDVDKLPEFGGGTAPPDPHPVRLWLHTSHKLILSKNCFLSVRYNTPLNSTYFTQNGGSL